MSHRNPTPRGSCPRCQAAIHTGDALITYETDDGDAAAWAECPDCGAIVHPQ